MVFFHVVKHGFYKSFSIFELCNLHYEFAKSQERKQTSFSGLRKSAEPTLPNIIKKGQRIIKINKFSIFEKH